MTIIVLILTSVMTYAGSVTYTYDGLNRLIRAEYEDGTGRNGGHIPYLQTLVTFLMDSLP